MISSDLQCRQCYKFQKYITWLYLFKIILSRAVSRPKLKIISVATKFLMFFEINLLHDLKKNFLILTKLTLNDPQMTVSVQNIGFRQMSHFNCSWNLIYYMIQKRIFEFQQFWNGPKMTTKWPLKWPFEPKILDLDQNASF